MSETMQREVEIISKIAVKDVGDPKGIFKAPEGERHYLGRLIGIATGTKNKMAPNGDVFTSILGDFQGIPADDQKPVRRSGVLYLPGGIHEMICEQLTDDGARVEFAFDVYTERATNPIGYSYAVNPVLAPSTTDPLARLMADSAGARPMPRKALAAPSEPSVEDMKAAAEAEKRGAKK